MQTLETEVYRRLEVFAKEREMTVQELLRIVIIPSWMDNQGGMPPRVDSDRTRAYVTRFVV